MEGREEEGGSSNGYVMLHGGEPTKSHTEKEQILWYMYYISVFKIENDIMIFFMIRR